MAFTRKMLKAMGIEDEKIDQIIEAHAETVDALKKQMSEYKDTANQFEEVKKERDKLKKDLENAVNDSFKDKYNELKNEYDGYKKEIEKQHTRAEKEDAYKKVLKELKISEKIQDKVLKLADLDSIELEEGKIKNIDKLEEGLKTEWADFIVTEGKKPAGISTPPGNGTGTAAPTNLADAIRESMKK